MAPQHFSLTNLVILPKLLLARRTFDYQHNKSSFCLTPPWRAGLSVVVLT
jgi:hypothetical protein